MISLNAVNDLDLVCEEFLTKDFILFRIVLAEYRNTALNPNFTPVKRRGTWLDFMN